MRPIAHRSAKSLCSLSLCRPAIRRRAVKLAPRCLLYTAAADQRRSDCSCINKFTQGFPPAAKIQSSLAHIANFSSKSRPLISLDHLLQRIKQNFVYSIKIKEYKIFILLLNIYLFNLRVFQMCRHLKSAGWFIDGIITYKYMNANVF